MINSKDRSIRIAINADVEPGVAGGVFQATQALIRSLGQLDGSERYVLIANTARQAEWLSKCVGFNQQIVLKGGRRSPPEEFRSKAVPSHRKARPELKTVLRPAVSRIRNALGRLVPQTPRIPLSDGFVESLQCDVLHFPTQGFTLCAVPTVFNPHDLQHLHYPEFWNAWELARRELVYRAGCVHSVGVVVGSNWAKDDLIRQYQIHSDKVHVILEGAAGTLVNRLSNEQVSEVLDRHALPTKYALYPANMWPHKNHVRLLEAVSILRDDKGLLVPLVLTGSKSGGAWPYVETTIAELGLQSLVHSLGFVSEQDLTAIQQNATCLVQPSLFEASSLPIFDAWMNGVPVAASASTALPEQIKDAGLLFDPMDSGSIADAIFLLWTQQDVREHLRKLGFGRIAEFDWMKTAKAYRAVYRRAARIKLDDEDRHLLGV